MIKIDNYNSNCRFYLSPPTSTSKPETKEISLSQKIRRIIDEVKIGDQRGESLKYIKYSRTTLSTLRIITKITWFILESGLFLKLSNGPIGAAARGLNTGLCVSGLIICALDTILELSGLFTQHKFRKKTQPVELKELELISRLQDPDKKHQKITEVLKKYQHCIASKETADRFPQVKNRIEHYILLEKLMTIQRSYFQISPRIVHGIDSYMQKYYADRPEIEIQERKDWIIANHLERKVERLNQRVRPWLSREIEMQLTPLITEMQSDDPEVRQNSQARAKALFCQMDMQIKKALIVHVVGLVGIALSTAGLIVSIVACPLAVPLSLLLWGAIIGIARYCMQSGWLNSNTWDLNPTLCIPEPVRNVYRLVKERILQIRAQKSEQQA